MTETKKEVSVYVHYPSCRKVCPYCDFTTVAMRRFPEQEYVAAMMCQIEKDISYYFSSVPSIPSLYFGGGTPSLMCPSSLDSLIKSVKALGNCLDDIEITLEVNPETVTPAKTQEWYAIGINRISLGVQSFQSASLAWLGRNHSPERVRSAINDIRSAGFKNISIDLMCGLPEQTLVMAESDVVEAIDYAPEHVSVYELIVERGTPYFFRREDGRLPLPHEDSVLNFLQGMSALLEDAGYHRYETCSFSPKGYESRHNLRYWQLKNYIGIGAGAHSCLVFDDMTASRWAMITDYKDYIKRVDAGDNYKSWSETLSHTQLAYEFLYLGLRQTDGVCLEKFRSCFGARTLSEYELKITPLLNNGLLLQKEGRLKTSKEGSWLLDSILESLL